MTFTGSLSTTQEIFDFYKARPTKILLSPGWMKPIASFVAFTRHRKARKQVVSVFLEYIPMARFTEDLAVAPSVSEDPIENVYVGITFYNGTNRERHHVDKMTHYLPVHSLDGLFQLYNATMADKLFDYYMCKGYSSPITAYLWGHFRQDFYEANRNHELFAHRIFEYFDEGTKTMEYSQLYLHYNAKRPTGQNSNTPFQLYCMKLPKKQRGYRADKETEEDWNSNQITENSVVLTRSQLVEVVEKIHWAVCALCGGNMDGGAGNDNEKKDPATSEVSSAVP